MKLALSLSILLGASSLFASQSLITKAKNAGLEAIPTDKSALMKLIDDPKDPITDAKVELGKKLYFDPRLSRSNLISCNTCHNLALGGADGVPAAIGHGWTANPFHLNSPTVYNSVFFKAQFWDGRSPHLQDQAAGPIQAAPEMAAPPALIVERINSIPAYVEEFKTAYGKDVKVDFDKITSAIATFERVLVTPSKFDKFLEGDENALNKAEKEGLDLFLGKGCTACHTGIALGGTMQPFQIANQYKFISVGDFKGDENGMVKTPSLRNITETAPYFHNGQFWALSDAVKEMGSVQLGINISDDDASKIVTFLGALKGDKPAFTYPQLPESTNKTPKPSFD
ncbi:cytochrome-c peroxidase [Arcobacter vandammei]|uniref:cytochrome-c peroxidase n=1 Tax=Arcobacter vandammei TaxID=2782243 RepID=UPI0018DFA055|nr:cytochrome-c peroxidase [Arcobacter vandammei]